MEKKRVIAFTIGTFALILLANTAYAEEAGIKDISSVKDTVKQYEVFEADINLPSPHNNPHDTEEVDLSAAITTPAGRILSVPAFYTGQESLWKVRYTPVKAGEFSYTIILKSASGTQNSGIRRFAVTPNNNADGFLRKDANNHFYPVFDSGKPFFGLGHDIAWVTNNNISAYEKYFEAFKENGCNLTRIWINSPWTFQIEGTKLCSYSSMDSNKLDSVIGLAKKYGIRIILVLDTYSSLMGERGSWDEQFWDRSPYNKTNGGPCEKPWEIFSSDTAKRCYKNRLRYVMARWGYSPNIIAFELFNEVDVPADWLKEMVAYIKSVNPHGQLITTSLGYPWGNNFNESSIWGLDEIDIIERHIYGNTTKDVIENLISINKAFSEKYKKPILVGEFGMDANKSDREIDDAGDGVALHNSIWAAAFSGSFSGALNWWWAEYVKGKNLYFHYKALRNFIADVKWNSKNVRFINTTPMIVGQANPKTLYSNIMLGTNDAWGEKVYSEFTVANNGDVSGGAINAYLHGAFKKEFKIEPVFHVNYPSDGKFIVLVDMVSQGANLVIYLDGKEMLKKELPAGPGEGPWKRSLYRKDYNIYQCVYDAPFEIAVPKGEHVIKIENTGKDWIRITKITLTNYMDSTFANARSLGLAVGDEMLFWVQNKEYNWRDVRKGLTPSTIKGASFKVKGVENGAYHIEWWDTFEGKVLLSQNINAKDNVMNISVPDFSKDLACKIRKGVRK